MHLWDIYREKKAGEVQRGCLKTRLAYCSSIDTLQPVPPTPHSLPLDLLPFSVGYRNTGFAISRKYDSFEKVASPRWGVFDLINDFLVAFQLAV
ncbi:hypothetical protein CDAR_223751 [Caerostris darwini]|uniref:Uncharacterized protein n=1 Tax=Caerostris darwini TaxID=1538125 RepID=A0AAV4S1M4_9ARAC|nr:hypothetical protein CDAR_223751 [Caerostris darwini]